MKRNDLYLWYVLQFEENARWTPIIGFRDTIENNKQIRYKPKHQIHNNNLPTNNLKPHILINFLTVTYLKLR